MPGLYSKRNKILTTADRRYKLKLNLLPAHVVDITAPKNNKILDIPIGLCEGFLNPGVLFISPLAH